MTEQLEENLRGQLDLHQQESSGLGYRLRDRFRGQSKQITQLLLNILLLGISGVALVPLGYIFAVSLQSMPQILKGAQIVPRPPTLEAYAYVFQKLSLLLYLRNTLIVVGFSLVGSLFSNTLAAYSFARFRFPGRDLIFTLLLSSMMLPEVVRLVPTYILFHRLGWLNTFLPLTVPSFFGNAFYIFFMRQFFSQIPKELFDAARIDGCHEWTILVKIVLPLSKPALATMVIFIIQFGWNDFIGPLLYLQRQSLRTLALALYAFRSAPQGIPTWNNLMAITVFMTLPILILFARFQRYFIEGITISGIRA